MVKTTTYQKDLVEALKDPCEAAAYLNAAIEEGDREVFLLALRNVAEANGGMSTVAEKANLSRESLYRMLSKRGNPEIKSLFTLLHTMGLRLAIETEPERYPLTSRVHEGEERYEASEREEEGDRDRIDDCVLALLQLTLHQGARAWKGFDYEVMDRLFQKGYILDPRGKVKSVVLTEEGLARSEWLFVELFGKR
jgi:probable addiction module antidote protein